MLKADFSTAAETDSSVGSSDAVLAQASSGQMRSSWCSFAGRFEVMDGSSLVRNRLALPVSIGLGGSVLRPLLTSVRTVQGYPRPPRLSGKPYSRVRVTDLPK